MGIQKKEDKRIEKFTWTIENFSKLDSKTYSETFFLGGYPWRVVIYPKGIMNNSDYLSLYLDAGNIAQFPKGWSRNASFDLALANQVNPSRTIVKQSKNVFDASHPSWGFQDVIQLGEFSDSRNGFIVNDTCIIKAEISVKKPEHEIPVGKAASKNDISVVSAPVKLTNNSSPKDSAPVKNTNNSSSKDSAPVKLTNNSSPKDSAPVKITNNSSSKDSAPVKLTNNSSPKDSAPVKLTNNSSPKDSAPVKITNNSSPKDSAPVKLTNNSSPKDSAPVKLTNNSSPKETSTASWGDLVDFRGLGKIEKAFVPMLEEVCSWHPSLVDNQRKRNRTRMFTEWAFTALGRVLHFLKTKKVKDMNDDACNELQSLWEELQTFGFDLSWLEPHLQSAVGMKGYTEKAAQIKRLKENVVALKEDLKIATKKLAEAKEGFVEKRDLDAELGYGPPPS